MSEKKHDTVVIVAEVDSEAEVITLHTQPLEAGRRIPRVHDFGASSGQIVAKSLWDKSDTSHEGIRRPGLRKKKGMCPKLKLVRSNLGFSYS